MSVPVFMKIASILLGVSAMTVQIVVAREIMAVFYGNEVSVGLILAAWLIWIAVGSESGMRIFKIRPNPSHRLFGALILACLLCSIVTIILVKHVRLILHVPYGEYISFFDLAIFTFFALAPVCLCLGLQFSYLASVSARRHYRPADPSAFIYMWESCGSMFASLFISLILLHWFGSLQSLLISFLLIFLIISMQKKKLLHWIVAAILFFACLSMSGEKVETRLAKNYWQSMGDGFQFIKGRQSRYAELAIIDWGGEKSLFANGVKQCALSDPIASQTLAALTMTQHPNPRQVLIMGGGLGGLVLECSRFPQIRIDYVEIDRVAFELAGRHSDREIGTGWHHPNVSVLHTDGRYFLKNSLNRYDLILVNMGNPVSAAINRYYTLEFFQSVRSRLKPDGVLALCNFPSSAEFLANELAHLNSILYCTLEQHFKDIVIVPGDQAIFFAAGKDSILTCDPELLAQRYVQAGVHSSYFFPAQFKQFYYPERIQYVRNTIQQHSVSRLNTDFNPVCYWYDFVHWNNLVQGKNSFFAKLSGISFAAVVFYVGVVLVLWLVISRIVHGKFSGCNLLGVTAIVGFAGMAFNVMLILSFQTIFGYLYEWIGIALGLYMLGMAMGSYVSNQYVPGKSSQHILGLVMICILLTGVIMMLILKGLVAFHSFPLFFCLVIWCGAITGGAFPLLCVFYFQITGQRRGARVYAADVIGGAAAALLVSGVIIPLWGFASACVLVSMVSGAGLIYISNMKVSM